MGDAPALPNVRCDGGYLAFFERVAEMLEAGVSHVEEERAADPRELLGLALTLVFSNLCHFVPQLDHRRVVEPAPAECRCLFRDEVRPHVDDLMERYIRVPIYSKEEGSDANLKAPRATSAASPPRCPELLLTRSCDVGSRTVPCRALSFCVITFAVHRFPFCS